MHSCTCVWGAVPQRAGLGQNYPNPFNAETMIRFFLPDFDEVELEVYDLSGQKVATLVEGMRQPGTHVVRWDGRDGRGDEVASGLYFYRLRVDAQMERRSMLLVR